MSHGFLGLQIFYKGDTVDTHTQCGAWDILETLVNGEVTCLHIFIIITESMDVNSGEGQGSLECGSPWGCKELDTTWWLDKQTNIYHLSSHFDKLIDASKTLSWVSRVFQNSGSQSIAPETLSGGRQSQNYFQNREGKGGMIWKNGTETCILAYMK